MSDEYLWDGTGEPDPLVADLEDKLSELAFEPVFVIEEPTVNVEPPPRRSSVRPFLLGSAVTAIAAAAASLLVWCGYSMGRQEAATPVVEEMVVGTPSVEAPPAVVPPPPKPVDSPVPIDADEKDEDAEDPPEPPVVAELDRPKVPTKPKKARPPKSPPPAGSSKTVKKANKGGDLDVDCILDPRACGKGTSGAKPTGASDPSLPEKLSTSDIRAGIAPVKAEAKHCGTKHGAQRGEKVKVKLSISGKTGHVTRASAQGPHAGTPLGNCVAAALKKAKFKRFRKASLGAVYPVTM